jgi:hypothetical protein
MPAKKQHNELIKRGPDYYVIQVTKARRAHFARLERERHRRDLVAEGRWEELRAYDRDLDASAGDLATGFTEVATWLGLSLASGLLGSAGWAILTEITRSFRRRRKTAKDVSRNSTPLTEDEAEAMAYLALCRILQPGPGGNPVMPRRADVETLRAHEKKQSWTIILEHSDHLYEVWVPQEDPMSSSPTVRQIW